MGEPWYALAFGDHYPLLYAHRDEDEARRCLNLLPKLAPLSIDRALPVLDLGCGDGRHLPFLGRQTPLVLGLDLSSSLLRVAHERLEAPQSAENILGLLRGDMREIPLTDGSCGGVLSLFTSFGYFGNLEANSIVMKEVARVMAPGGCWFLDYLDCDRVRSELSDQAQGVVRIRELGPCRFTERRRLAVQGQMVIKDVEIMARPGHESEASKLGITAEGLRYAEQVALFSLSEIDTLAVAYGLFRRAGVGSYMGAPLGTGERWLLVYEKSLVNRQRGHCG